MWFVAPDITLNAMEMGPQFASIQPSEVLVSNL